MFLYVLEGPDKGSFFPVNQEKIQLGRAPSNDIRITDDKVSSRHLQIELKTAENNLKKFYIKDMESTNGTFLNGYQIQETTIALREKLLIGNTLFMFCTEEDANQIKKGVELSDTPPGNVIKKVSSSKDTGVILDKLESSSTKQELEQASKRLNGLYKLLRLIHSSVEGENTILTKVLDCTLELLPADRCLASLYDEKKGTLIADSVQRAGGQGDLFSLSKTITREVIEQKTGILTLDAREDYRFKDGDSVWGLNIRSLMCSPIMFQDQVLGIINVDSQTSGNFTEEDLALLNAIGREAGVAIQNYRLYLTTVKTEKLAAIGQTVASVSHYIKNILTGMKGGAYLVDNSLKKQDMPGLEKGWNIVKKSQNKISELVLDMLNFARQTSVVCSLQELNPMLEEILLTIEASDWGKIIHVQKNLGDIPPFQFDSTGIHRCLLNLLYNAIDAMQEEGTLSVTTRVQDRFILIEIADTGCGISPEMREKIFEIFVTTKGSKGTGIGLAVTKKIILEHGGTIEVESEINQGSCFTIKLPLIQ